MNISTERLKDELANYEHDDAAAMFLQENGPDLAREALESRATIVELRGAGGGI